MVPLRRVLVLSLQGDILQVFTHPTEPTAAFHSLCCFNHKLLASYVYYVNSDSGWKRCTWKRRTCFRVEAMLALQGL